MRHGAPNPVLDQAHGAAHCVFPVGKPSRQLLRRRRDPPQVRQSAPAAKPLPQIARHSAAAFDWKDTISREKKKRHWRKREKGEGARGFMIY